MFMTFHKETYAPMKIIPTGFQWTLQKAGTLWAFKTRSPCPFIQLERQPTYLWMPESNYNSNYLHFSTKIISLTVEIQSSWKLASVHTKAELLCLSLSPSPTQPAVWFGKVTQQGTEQFYSNAYNERVWEKRLSQTQLAVCHCLCGIKQVTLWWKLSISGIFMKAVWYYKNKMSI